MGGETQNRNISELTVTLRITYSERLTQCRSVVQFVNWNSPVCGVDIREVNRKSYSRHYVLNVLRSGLRLLTVTSSGETKRRSQFAMAQVCLACVCVCTVLYCTGVRVCQLILVRPCYMFFIRTCRFPVVYQ